MRQRHRLTAVGSRLADLHRTRPALACEHDGFAVRRELHIVQRVTPADGHAGTAAIDIEELNRLPPSIDYGEKQTRRIGRPNETIDGPIDEIGHIRERAGGSLEHHQTPTV